MLGISTILHEEFYTGNSNGYQGNKHLLHIHILISYIGKIKIVNF